jgi:hypothetical protein
MIKLLTNREMELLRVAINLEEELDKCHPDIGMGPSRIDIAKRVVNKLSFKIDEDDIAEICEDITGS